MLFCTPEKDNSCGSVADISCFKVVGHVTSKQMENYEKVLYKYVFESVLYELTQRNIPSLFTWQ